MGLYCGIDLHAKNSYLAIIDEQRKRVFNRNVTNNRETILSFLDRVSESHVAAIR